jgi:hypothetical protein
MLDFPDTVSREDELGWASKALTQQINEYAAQGWEMVNINWLTDKEIMVTFKRPAAQNEPNQAAT